MDLIFSHFTKMLTRFWKRLKRTSRIRLLLLLLTTIGTALITGYIVYDEASRLSVSGTAIGFVGATRTKASMSLTYHITVRVGSWQTSVETHLNSPLFWLRVDGLAIGETFQGDTKTFKPYETVDYSLTFSESSSTTIGLIGNNQPHSYEIVMSSIVSAGGYQESLGRSTSTLWSFP
jgi:hypothetical protein